MNPTKIEWTRNPDGTPGWTWNPITGCLNGCPYCYARRDANGRLKQRYLANRNIALPIDKTNLIDTEEFGRIVIDPISDPFYPRFWPDKLEELKPNRWWDNLPTMSDGEKLGKKRKGIFVCNMSDLFGKGVPHEWTEQVLDAIKECPYHRLYLLTKQPQNLAKFSPFPDNCWVGVSATDDKMFCKAVVALNQIKAKVKYISFEPLLDRVVGAKAIEDFGGLDWIILGSQTRPTVLPKIEWVQEIVEAADKAGVKVFLKDSLKPLLSEGTFLQSGQEKQLPNTDWAFRRGFLRQEMPHGERRG